MDTETVVKALNTSPITMNSDGEMVLEPIPSKYGITFMVGTVLFFEFLNKLTINQYSVKTQNFEFWRWKNLFISWIHAGIVSVWTIYSLVEYGNECLQDLIAYNNFVIYFLVAFSAAYFCYDFIDIIKNRYAGQMWEVLVHHVCIATMFSYNVIISRCVAFNVVALVVEINSFFLHSRKLLQLLKVSFDHWFYRVICWCNLITFFIFRFGALIAIYYGIYAFGHRVSSLYLAGLWPSCIIMHVINMVLFWRLIKSDVMKVYFKRKPSAAVISNNNEKEVHLNDHSHKNGYVQNGHAVAEKEKAS